jgi:signal transduction histidine kinase
MDLAAIDAGRLYVDLRPYNVGPLLSDCAEAFRMLTMTHGLELTVRPPAHEASVTCDHERVLQVFSNLIGNAVKVTPAGGSITLSVVEHDEQHMKFSIADTGPGIPAEAQHGLFSRYHQAGVHTTRHGIGLGLSIVRGLVEAQGGHVWVESTVGVGTVFNFTLPRVAPSEA